ncbi:MAG: cache domain-containing protein [Granulosicoccus sp.]|nr:cache domain-containing protein [Granulosicoccus sp.]
MNSRLLASSRFRGLRYRLLALVLVPLIVLSGAVLLLVSNWSSDYTYEQLFTKVTTDLRVASNSFSRIQLNGRQELDWLAHSALLREHLAKDDLPALQMLLDQRRELAGFDFLKLWSADTKQMLQEENWRESELRDSALTRQLVNAQGQMSAGTDALSGIEIYSREQWNQEPDVDAATVLLPLVATERAAPSDRTTEDRAMIIRSLQPVIDEHGKDLGLLEAGLLLNRNFQFVDQIRDLVYGPGSLVPGSRGTVTVFLDDVRISTNVPTVTEDRALGTRVSSQVRDAVLKRGESWVDRAFVVNDWYISAYEPIVDVSGRRVGMLYAGYLEAPFRDQLFTAITVLTALVLAGSLLAAAAAALGARAIFRPIEAITEIVRATARGQHKRIGPIRTGDEIGELAFQFDAMLDSLSSQRQRIERDALLLEEKVQHRTLELKTQNQRLQESIDLLNQTRQQLATAEKLAALGELTAGVAHEINNPIAVILGNIDVVNTELGDSSDVVQTEIDLIIEQVYRIRSITERLLQYSRSADLHHTSHAPSRAVALKPLIDETLKLLSHQLVGKQIQVNLTCDTELGALIDPQELQQVLINLFRNAIESIGFEGEVNVHCCEADHSRVRIVVEDTGCGIDEMNLARVFDPFFTDGKAQGTGLGLSVSYGIVRRSGGSISVSSQMSLGSRFVVELPGAICESVSV